VSSPQEAAARGTRYNTRRKRPPQETLRRKRAFFGTQGAPSITGRLTAVLCVARTRDSRERETRDNRRTHVALPMISMWRRWFFCEVSASTQVMPPPRLGSAVKRRTTDAADLSLTAVAVCLLANREPPRAPAALGLGPSQGVVPRRGNWRLSVKEEQVVGCRAQERGGYSRRQWVRSRARRPA
jgi:hypothetical protein